MGEEECLECKIAGAVAGFNYVCSEHPELDCAELANMAENPETEPAKWVEKLVEIQSKATGEAAEKLGIILEKLCEALEGSEYGEACSCRIENTKGG
jgi:hypothetical protein